MRILYASNFSSRSRVNSDGKQAFSVRDRDQCQELFQMETHWFSREVEAHECQEEIKAGKRSVTQTSTL